MADTPDDKDNRAAAFRDEKKPGPTESPVQVRNSGEDATRDGKSEAWDETDEASDESFPASDASAKY